MNARFTSEADIEGDPGSRPEIQKHRQQPEL
jgi:hypothetical protein